MLVDQLSVARQTALSMNKQSRAFTLIELLVVVAIIVMMTGLAVPTFTNIGKTNSLSSSGNQVANLLNLARQNSMSKNSMTALVVQTDSQTNNAYRSIALMELPNQSKLWKQISGWETLPSGTIVDPGPDGNPAHPYQFSFNRSSDAVPLPGVPQQPFPSIAYGGKTVNSYSYEIFLPNGSLLSGSAVQIRVAGGYVSSGVATYTQPDSHGGGPANYYEVTILAGTGRTKIDRP